MSYFVWNEKVNTDFAEETISSLYNEGYVFTRLGHGVMHQTRSVRVDLGRFALSSENRRILKKSSNLKLRTSNLPLSEYDWSIGKMAKNFYDVKFGKGTFSANKIKELLTDSEKSNFNALLIYSLSPYQGESEGVFSKSNAGSSADPSQPPLLGEEQNVGYCIAYSGVSILHYAYPFYDTNSPKSNGMTMMLHALSHAEEGKKKYIYLGSASRPTDTYKLQFKGLEWFDGMKWQTDTETLKKILKNAV